MVAAMNTVGGGTTYILYEEKNHVQLPLTAPLVAMRAFYHETLLLGDLEEMVWTLVRDRRPSRQVCL